MLQRKDIARVAHWALCRDVRPAYHATEVLLELLDETGSPGSPQVEGEFTALIKGFVVSHEWKFRHVSAHSDRIFSDFHDGTVQYNCLLSSSGLRIALDPMMSDALR